MSYQIAAARRRTIVCTLLTMFVAACSDYTSPSAPTPAAIAAVSGDGQTGIVGAMLASPIVFEVTSTSDAPVSGVTVAFSVTSGSGTVSPTTAVTDANGTASTQLTLGNTTGAVEVTATVQGGTLIARAGATAMQIASGDCTSSAAALSVGQVITGLTGTSLCIAGGSTGGEFALVPFNTSLDGSAATPFVAQAGGVTATAVASLTPSKGAFSMLAGGSPSSAALSSQTLTRALDARLRASERRDLTPLIAGARTWMRSRQRTPSGSVPGLALSVVPSTARVGELVTLNANAESAC